MHAKRVFFVCAGLRAEERDLITKANLMVATLNDAARIAMLTDWEAREVIALGRVGDVSLNLIEVVFHAYDPCRGCAPYALPKPMPLVVRIQDLEQVIRQPLR